MIKKISLAILLGAAGILIWQLNKSDTLTVDTIPVDIGLTETTVVNTRAGSITACKRSKLALAVGGQIAVINVKEGQQVKRGETLLNLWNKDLKAQVNSAEASVIAADFTQQSLCIINQSDQREAVRLNNLVAKKLASQGQFDLAQAKAHASKAACTSAKASWQQKIAMLAQAQATIEKTYLVAPFDGTIGEISGEIGEFSTPSPPGVQTPPAIDLLTTDCHYVTAPIDEVDAGKIALDMPVRITLDAFRGQIFLGKVKRIAAYVQDYAKQARTVAIEIDFDNTDKLPKLLAGYSVDVEIILASASNSLRVPTDTIMDNNTVYIINNLGEIEKRNISLGLTNWKFSEVTQGLKKSEQVIINAANIANISAGLPAISRQDPRQAKSTE
ncbi:MAG: efflux RND transporter periplasmic adaptor subunit [Colwellia sp.]|nr:efflux RND transporter periplasmic adaptor subunit [Colwellia sp.]